MKKPKLLAPLLLTICIFTTGAANAELAGIFEDHPGSSSLKSFPKWIRVKTRHPKDLALVGEPCENRKNSCFMNEWMSFLDSIRGKSREEQIRQVNSQMNRSPYITDIANWGMQDYWETPLEFFKRHGDCEDYAISKFYSLKELGFTNEDMRIIVLMDNNIKEVHSILVVHIDGKELVLDNQVKQVVDATRIHHYQPIYAVNEKGWWRYQ